MEREIKFRGKRIDNGDFADAGEWVYGVPITTHIGIFICYEENPHFCHLYGYMEIDGIAKVDPPTVGQFTGLQAKDGTDVYEGDIVKYKEMIGIVKFGRFDSNLGFYIDWIDEGLLRKDIIYWTELKKIEVIGNTFENKDLLGGD